MELSSGNVHWNFLPGKSVYESNNLQISCLRIAHVEWKRLKLGIKHIDITFDDIVLIEDITIGEKLGAGNFSEVYKGVWQVRLFIGTKAYIIQNSAIVALKRLKNAEQAIAFIKEARVLQ